MCGTVLYPEPLFSAISDSCQARHNQRVDSQNAEEQDGSPTPDDDDGQLTATSKREHRKPIQTCGGVQFLCPSSFPHLPLFKRAVFRSDQFMCRLYESLHESIALGATPLDCSQRHVAILLSSVGNSSAIQSSSPVRARCLPSRSCLRSPVQVLVAIPSFAQHHSADRRTH